MLRQVSIASSSASAFRRSLIVGFFGTPFVSLNRFFVSVCLSAITKAEVARLEVVVPSQSLLRQRLPFGSVESAMFGVIAIGLNRFFVSVCLSARMERCRPISGLHSVSIASSSASAFRQTAFMRYCAAMKYGLNRFFVSVCLSAVSLAEPYLGLRLERSQSLLRQRLPFGTTASGSAASKPAVSIASSSASAFRLYGSGSTAGDAGRVSIASSSASAFRRSYCVVSAGWRSLVSIASSSASAFRRKRPRSRRPRISLVSIASSSASAFRLMSVRGLPRMEGRVSIASSSASAFRQGIQLRNRHCARCLNRFFVSVCLSAPLTALTFALKNPDVSIASSSASAFRPMAKFLQSIMVISRSQSLLRQRLPFGKGFMP